MMDIAEEKVMLRKELLKFRDELNPEIKKYYDTMITDKVLNLIRKNDFKNIHCFIPMGSEINTWLIIDELLKENRTVIAPKVLKNRLLEHLVLDKSKKLEKGRFGTQHPSGNQIFTGEIEIIIVPALAYDECLNRIGYGGGFYDAFLSKHFKALKVGICYPFQELKRIPLSPNDYPVDMIITS